MNEPLSETPYGIELAKEVTAKLEKVNVLAYNHRDYCGTGFYYDGITFYYGYFSDGMLAENIQIFESREEFIQWLSVQSDERMSVKYDKYDANGTDHQRITEMRLMEFVLGGN